ncbi:MAG TPA: TldD/PmbA family protein [Acidimicrobiales bacterium]|nr:TldD/PmbA family protein [Acidimicrobiales bacterium]
MSASVSVVAGDEVEAELAALARDVVRRAEPGEDLEVTIGRGRRTTVRAHGGEVESFTSATTSGLGIRVVVDHREGFAHAGSLAPDVVADTLAEARDNARFATPDDHVGLVEPDGVEAPEMVLWHPGIEALTDDERIDRAVGLERAVRADPRIRTVRTSVWSDGVGWFALAATSGIERSGRSGSCSASISAIGGDGDDTATGYGVDASRDPSAIDLDAVAAEAIERTTELLGARPVPSRRVALVLEPRLAATVLGIVAGTLTGDAVAKGRSPFADRLGDTVASALLELVDDPTDGRSLGAEPHDGEGLASRRNVLISDGVLRGFLHDGTSARRASTRSTASAVRGTRGLPSPGVRALAVRPGTMSPAELLAEVGDGFVVRSFAGLHSGVNPVSGDLSVGAEGRILRGGELAEPVREVTLATSLQRLLLDLRAVADDLTWLPGGAGAPTIVVDGVSLGGR